MNAPGLPHHRRGPRVDEKRRDDDDPGLLAAIIGIGLAALLLIAIGIRS